MLYFNFCNAYMGSLNVFNRGSLYDSRFDRYWLLAEDCLDSPAYILTIITVLSRVGMNNHIIQIIRIIRLSTNSNNEKIIRILFKQRIFANNLNNSNNSIRRIIVKSLIYLMELVKVD